MISERINLLSKTFATNKIDGYIIPKNDEFFGEYSSQDRLKIISNFDGSAGLAIILKDKNFLFVDGRYTIQAKKQSDDFEFNQDIDIGFDNGYRSPGWERFKKNKALRWKKKSGS